MKMSSGPSFGVPGSLILGVLTWHFAAKLWQLYSIVLKFWQVYDFYHNDL
jgi:hypothetical protein